MSQVLRVNGDYLVKVSDAGTIKLDTGTRVGEVLVTGDLVVDRNLTVNGGMTLGNEGIDQIRILGKIKSDLIPADSNFWNIGDERDYWNKLYVSQILNPLGNLTIKNLVDPVDPQDAATKSYVDTALGAVKNVYYVSKSGNDLNDGRSLGKAKLTIKSAVQAATNDIDRGYDATIFVKSGDFTEDNPIRLPRKLSIYGDGLRATTVRPLNKQQDLFWVTNGNYIANITIKDHEAPAAAVAFPPPSEEFPPVSIFQSPYVQNCTSITTTGCGMRVDGNNVLGLKSMVLDAYTQYNQGGLGIHMLNRGNSQLVSAFTINCDIAFLCTSGGFCSLTNSNSSFGNFGLVADGVSEPLITGILQGDALGITGDTVVLNNLVQRPNVGDAVSFNSSTNYYTVTSATELSAGDVALVNPDFSDQPQDFRTARQLVLSSKDKIAVDTIDYVNDTYKYLDYNQFKCTRDTNLIIDAAIDDMALNTNYKSIQAGLSYSRLSAAVVREEQLAESLDALLFTKSESLNVLSSDSTTQSEEYLRLESKFDLIYSLFQDASAVNPPEPPAYEFNLPVGVTPGREAARDIILANRNFLIQEGIAYIEANLTFSYDRETCRRDIGLIIDAIGYDLMFGSNFRSITAGRSYYRAQASTVVGVQKTATLDAFKFLKQTLLDFLTTNAEAYESVESNMNLIIDILDQGLSAVPPEYTIPNPIDYDEDFENARNLIELNRDFIKAEVIEYIEQNFSSFVYNQETCQRDIGLIIDALGYDLMFGSNFRSITAGRSYTRANASVVTSTQKAATIDAFNFLKDRLNFLVLDNPAAVASITDNVNLIIDIFDNGLSSVPARPYTIPAPTGYAVGFQNARNLIEANRDFIKAEIIEFIDQNYVIPNGFVYDSVACERDVDLILDAVYYDLTYGGNLETLVAGRAYYSYGSSLIPGEETETLGAYDRLKTIIIQIAQNQDVTELQAVVAQVLGTAGSVAAAGAAGQLIENIRTFISTPETPPAEVAPSTGWVSQILIQSFNTLQSRKNSVKVEVTNYIDENYGFEYDKTDCIRDIGYILDAIYYDMTYGGNLETLIAGNAYYSYGTSLIPGEETATLESYAYMRDIIAQISLNGEVTALQGIVDQTFGTPGSTVSADYAASLVEDIRSIIAQDPKPEIRYPDLRWVRPDFVEAHDLFQDEKDDTQRLVTNYIDSRFFLLDYNRAVCQRDVGLIIDAVAYDMMFGSNFRTITAARSYWRGTASTVTGIQRTATIDAFNQLKKLLTPLVFEAADPSSSNRVSDLMDIILQVLSDGIESIPAIETPEPTDYSAPLERARNLIDANREFITAEVNEFIVQNYAISDSIVASTCARDIDLILDAVYYDLTYGGNLETLIAGRAYYSFNQTVIPGEEVFTLAAYAYMRTLVEQVAQSLEITPLQLDVVQVGGVGGDLESAQKAAALIENIRTIIAEPDNEPAAVTPSLDWVDPLIVSRANVLFDSKETVKDQVTDFIDSRYNTNITPFAYDRDKCLRDVGLIVDALSWDLMFGSNFRSITAGRSYSRANASVVFDRQKQATIEAYEILRDYVADLLSENALAVESVTDNMDLIIDIFDQGLTAVPEYVTPRPTNLGEGVERARNLIESNKEFIVAEVINYIADNQQSSLNYDKDICQRDIGLIIDAIGYDMLFSSNFRSITAGRAYTRANASVAIVTSVQKAATIDAFGYLKSLLAAQVAGIPAAVSSVNENMDTIIDIFDNGLSAIPSYSTPNPTGYVDGFKNARNLIEANREFIKAEVTAWLDYNYVDFDSNYDSSTCQRDIRLIIDAVSYDLVTGSNFASSVAGSAYYRLQSATVINAQLLQTVASITHAKELSVTYVDETVVEAVENAFDNVISILQNGLAAVPGYVFPDNGTSTPTTVADSATIRNNKSAYQTGVANYISTTYPELWDDLGASGQNACTRDIGYVVDAVSYDVQYGGNYQSIVAGEAYYSFGTLQIDPSEETATLAAYEQLKTLIQADVPSSSATVGNLIDNIKTTIDTGTAPATVYPSATGESTEIQTSVGALQTDKTTIATGVTQFITDTFSSLVYDIPTCERDVDYILDAVYYDLTYGGNLETSIAGEAYYSFGTLQIDTDDKTATLGVYDYMKNIIFSIAQNLDINEYQNSVLQVSGTAGSNPAAVAARSLIEGIITTIDTGTAPARVAPSIAWVDAGRRERFAILQDNKEDTKIAVTGYIDDYYPFDYDRETCQRDVGLILDAVGYDIMFGSNFRSITAGRAYYRAGAAAVTTLQKEATMDAFKYLKDLIINTVSENATAVTRASANMDIILDILENGLSSVPAFVTPSPTGYDTGFENARNLIEANRNFIKAETIEYIRVNFVVPQGFEYDAVACARDIDLILDAVYYDMTYGGNMETVIAGNAYYSYGINQLGMGETDETLLAYDFMKEIIIQIAQNQDVTELQAVVAQVLGTAGSLEAATAAGQLIDDVRSIINDPMNPPTIVFASTTWVAPTLVAQYNRLQTDKNLIKGQVTHYIDVEYVEPSYDREKCERDIRYILDAVYYDLTYGGNMETAIAANSYFVDAVTVIPGEVEATIRAYRHMKEIVIDIAQNIPVVALQQKISQTFGIPGWESAAVTAGELIQDIIDVIDNQTLITAPTLADTSWVSSDLVDSYDLLQAEKENVKIAVGDFIDAKFFLLTYNREKCLRDIGYIIDALGYDVMFGSNFRSIVAGRSYYRANANVVLQSQKSATIGSLRRLKELLTVSALGNSTALERLEDNIELIVSIINVGPSAIPEYEIPNPTSGFSSLFANGRNLVDLNRPFIIAEVIKYIEINYPLVYASMDSLKCQRDIDYIIDAIYYDITYGTNAESLVAGRSYYAGTALQLGSGELTATLDSYGYLKILVGKVAVNEVVIPLQTESPQILGTPGDSQVAIELEALVQEIIDYITDPNNPPEFRPADTGWVSSGLVTVNDSFQANKEFTQTQIQRFIDNKYAYSQEICRRDIGYILDAMVYDHLYGGNSQTIAAAETYYSAGVFQIGARERIMTANTFKYLKSIGGSCLLNIPVTALQNIVVQNLSLLPSDVDQVIKSNELFGIVAEVVENGFTSTVTLNETIPDFDPQFPGVLVTFHQYSLVTASGHTFEWVGAGVNVNTSLPYLGGLPDPEAKAVEINGGKVYWTGTDQTGDFNIGGELVIRRDSGTIEGRTFTKSLFAVLTPYILAVGE
jgi:hypothetical protein